jgi:hypothetical protein
MRKIFGQLEQNLAKSGQTLEKVSQPRGLSPIFNFGLQFF